MKKITNHEQVEKDLMMSDAANSPSARVYQVAWFSPRGFANEGSYVFGDKDALAECMAKYESDTDAVFDVVKDNLSTMIEAKKSAENRARNDAKNTPEHDKCSISSMGTDEFLFG